MSWARARNQKRARAHGREGRPGFLRVDGDPEVGKSLDKAASPKNEGQKKATR